MFFAVARAELLISQSRSLKEKRAVLNRIRDRLHDRFRVSVSEVDHQDLWQRAALGVALVALAASSARDGLEAIRREIESDPRLVVIAFETLVRRFDDLPADRAPGSERRGEG